MAEIRVEPRKQPSAGLWIWIILLLLIVVAVVYFLTRGSKEPGQQVPEPAVPAAFHEIHADGRSVLMADALPATIL